MELTSYLPSFQFSLRGTYNYVKHESYQMLSQSVIQIYFLLQTHRCQWFSGILASWRQPAILSDGDHWWEVSRTSLSGDWRPCAPAYRSEGSSQYLYPIYRGRRNASRDLFVCCSGNAFEWTAFYLKGQYQNNFAAFFAKTVLNLWLIKFAHTPAPRAQEVRRKWIVEGISKFYHIDSWF